MANRETYFRPDAKRDVALLHEDGWYLPSIPRKIGGAEKVAQMAAILLVYNVRMQSHLVKTVDYDAIPFIVAAAVRAAEQAFENDPALPPDDNLERIEVRSLELDSFTKELFVKLDVYTQAGELAPLLLRIPLVPKEDASSVKIQVKIP